jgi:hypothetical protein
MEDPSEFAPPSDDTDDDDYGESSLMEMSPQTREMALEGLREFDALWVVDNPLPNGHYLALSVPGDIREDYWLGGVQWMLNQMVGEVDPPVSELTIDGPEEPPD